MSLFFSTKRVGGLRFVRIGRLSVSFAICATYKDLNAKPLASMRENAAPVNVLSMSLLYASFIEALTGVIAMFTRSPYMLDRNRSILRVAQVVLAFAIGFAVVTGAAHAAPISPYVARAMHAWTECVAAQATSAMQVEIPPRAAAEMGIMACSNVEDALHTMMSIDFLARFPHLSADAQEASIVVALEEWKEHMRAYVEGAGTPADSP